MTHRFKLGLPLAALAAAMVVLLCYRFPKSADRPQQFVVREDLPKIERVEVPIVKPALPVPKNEPIPRPAAPPTPITMRYRTIELGKELPAGLATDEKRIWLAEFDGPLTRDAQDDLKNSGIEVLFPAIDGAFHVRASFLSLSAGNVNPPLRGWARLAPSDRFSGQLTKALISAKPQLRLRIDLYPGGDVADARKSVIAAGAKDISAGGDWLEFLGPRDANWLAELARNEHVYIVGLAQRQKRSFNQDAANASNADIVTQAPLSLSGSGVKVMVRDGGRVFAHADFDSRLLLGSDVLALPADQHATHVAATIAGSGAGNTGARGFAPLSTVISFDFNDSDDVNDLQEALTDHQSILSNHSYGFPTGWDGGEYQDDTEFGEYTIFARKFDSLIFNQQFIIVKAIGNDRNDSGTENGKPPHDGVLKPDGEYYFTTDESTTSKNILSVGAALDGFHAGISNAGVCLTAGSGSGPTKDGRLRPEIIANGDNVLSCDKTAGAYTRLTGTSQACAAVTGATALFLERYKQLFGASANCSPWFLRAIYAQTATDMGRTGPDYLHGFGLLDISAAINVLNADAANNRVIVNSQLAMPNPRRFYVMNCDGTRPVKATVCWNEPPADPLARPEDRVLLNDLNIKIVRSQDFTEFLPFTLDPANPHLPAARAVNSVDNIEQVVVNNPPPGFYLVEVSASNLATTPTNFALVTSYPVFEELGPTAVGSITPTSGLAPLEVFCNATGSSDPDGVIFEYLWTFGDGSSVTGLTVQHTYGEGTFFPTLKVTDQYGASSVLSFVVSVSNELPEVVFNFQPNAGPAPLSVSFSAVGSGDPDGFIADYFWRFGDGTVADGIEVQHTYTQEGIYIVSLTATDNGNGQVVRTGLVVVGGLLTTKSASFGLNFTLPQKLQDKFAFSSKAASPPITGSFANKQGTIYLGTAQYPFILDEKGKFKSGPMNVTFNAKSGAVSVKLSKTILAAALASTGATNRNAKKEIVNIPFGFKFDGGSFWGAPNFHFKYTAKLGKSGTGAFTK